jgi:hypothetical protein
MGVPFPTCALLIRIRIDMDSYFLKKSVSDPPNVKVCNKGLTMGPTCPTLCSSGKGATANGWPHLTRQDQSHPRYDPLSSHTHPTTP